LLDWQILVTSCLNPKYCLNPKTTYPCLED
jgi:hypothetical protein